MEEIVRIKNNDRSEPEFQKSVATKISSNLLIITLFFMIAILFAFLTTNLAIKPIDILQMM